MSSSELFAYVLVFGGMFLIPAIGVWALIKQNSVNKKLKNKRDSDNRWMSEEGITSSVEYEWTDSLSDRHYRFVVDDVKKQVVIFEGVQKKSMTRIPYNEIIGFETMTNDTMSGGVGRAIVGGALAGGAGAIVGAATRKTKINSYKACIYKNTVVDASYTFVFISESTDADDVTYKLAMEFTEKINSTIRAIIAYNERNN